MADVEFLPLAVAGAAGVALGRIVGWRGSSRPTERHGVLPGAARVTTRAAGATVSTAARAAGVATQGVGLAAVATGSAAFALARGVDAVTRPRAQTETKKETNKSTSSRR